LVENSFLNVWAMYDKVDRGGYTRIPCVEFRWPVQFHKYVG
jgi:hypothetical protein